MSERARASRARRTGVALASRPDAVTQLRYTGPDAEHLLSRTSIGGVRDWEVGTSRHLVSTSDDGLVVTHGGWVRDASDAFRQIGGLPWAASRAARLGWDVAIGAEDVFAVRVLGPEATVVVERLLDRAPEGPAGVVQRTGPGGAIDVERLRRGSSLAPGFEIRGPLALHGEIDAALVAIGEPLGMVRLDEADEVVARTELGLPEMGISFLSAALDDDDFLRDALGARPAAAFTGSADPARRRLRYRTPQELGWAGRVRFDHDFDGRSALAEEAARPTRTTVTLAWDAADATAFPRDASPSIGGHADLVTTPDGSPIGVASATVFSDALDAVLSQTAIHLEDAEVGTRVLVHRGEFGGRLETVRATVARAPGRDRIA